MRYLLDTHTFIWFIDGSDSLPEEVKNEIVNIENECFISIASIWEIAIKCSIGKLKLTSDFHNITNFLAIANIELLNMEFTDIQTLLTLDFYHRDPFDRMIIAQAITKGLTILTIDKLFAPYPVLCRW